MSCTSVSLSNKNSTQVNQQSASSTSTAVREKNSFEPKAIEEEDDDDFINLKADVEAGTYNLWLMFLIFSACISIYSYYFLSKTCGVKQKNQVLLKIVIQFKLLHPPQYHPIEN